MTGYPIGTILLIIISILIYFGLAHRVLDRLQLSDKTALIIIAAIIAGSFIDIPLLQAPLNLSVNVGGALVPVGLAIYLLIKAGSTKEWIRALIATTITGLTIFLVNTYLLAADPWETGRDFLDPLYTYPLIAASIGYLAGRSRRSSFIAATLGVISLDVIDFLRLLRANIPGRVAIGGAGAFDAIILAGIAAVLLAEIVGESRERLQGGPETEGRPAPLLKALDGVRPKTARKPENYQEGKEQDE
ncbi:MAG: DUF1614 domain-containing protein [Clostridia bacterium]|jgi:uncharacterized membrane protein|nr:DUF1614 domain-containing protein [Clostridia bacterium]